MAFSDIFANSISGIDSGLALLDASARSLEDSLVATWEQEPVAEETQFDQVLTAKLEDFLAPAVVPTDDEANVNGPTSDPTDADRAGIPVTPVTVEPLELLPLTGRDLVDSLLDMILAEQLIAADAQALATQAREMRTLIDLEG